MPGGDTEGGRRSFPTTQWSIILQAQTDAEAKEVAMHDLLGRYWRPLYYFVRRKGQDRERAQDAVQGFIAHLLEKDFLQRLDPEKGRLRSFLRVSFDRYLADQWDKAQAKKRGGSHDIIPMDFEVAESDLTHTPMSPDDAYEFGWAQSLIARALEGLRQEFVMGTRSGNFEVVRRFFGTEAVPSYEDAAAEYGMSVPQLKSFLHRARARYRKLLAEEVAATVASDNETNAELTAIMAVIENG